MGVAAVTTRVERLKAIRMAYESWSEKTPFINDFEASEIDESNFLEILATVEPKVADRWPPALCADIKPLPKF